MPIKKILVVDDSPTERFALTEFLGKHGYSVLAASSGEESVIKARQEKPDLILMDVVMPGVSGYQATRTIARDDITRSIPIIMTTSKDQETDRIWGMRQGAFDYMTKPLNLDHLLAKIVAMS